MPKVDLSDKIPSFEKSLVGANIDKSSPETFAKTLESALLGFGIEVGEDPNVLFERSIIKPKVVDPKNIARYLPKSIFRVRIKVVEKKVPVPKSADIYNYDDDDLIDFDKVTADFSDKQTEAVQTLTTIITETLAYRQGLKNVVAHFAEKPAFSDLSVNMSTIDHLMNIRVAEQICEFLQLDKVEVVKMLFGNVREKK